MTADFIAIDVETANSDPRSICQIGAAQYRDGELAREWKSYINPKADFDPMNVSIHGITATKVRRSPSLPDVAGRLRELMDGEIVICHTHFDRVAINKAFDSHSIPPLHCQWLDSAMIARRAWSGLNQRGGYGLANLCLILGYSYQHHDALADAKAAGVVALAAVKQTGLGLEQWLRQVKRPVKEGPQLFIYAPPQSLYQPGDTQGTHSVVKPPTAAAGKNVGNPYLSESRDSAKVAPRRSGFLSHFIKRLRHKSDGRL